MLWVSCLPTIQEEESALLTLVAPLHFDSQACAHGQQVCRSLGVTQQVWHSALWCMQQSCTLILQPWYHRCTATLWKVLGCYDHGKNLSPWTQICDPAGSRPDGLASVGNSEHRGIPSAGKISHAWRSLWTDSWGQLLTAPLKVCFVTVVCQVACQDHKYQAPVRKLAQIVPCSFAATLRLPPLCIQCT